MPAHARRLLLLLAALTALTLASVSSALAAVGAQNSVRAFSQPGQARTGLTALESSCSRPGSIASGREIVAGFCVAAEGVSDDAFIVRGGQSEMPGAGELFSGAQGETVEDAAAGVPHGTIRSTTAGEIRAGGGTVDYAPEFNSNVGATNYQHVNVMLGESNPFSEPFGNPVPKSGRFGGPDYPYGP
jgi:hypothetical protein